MNNIGVKFGFLCFPKVPEQTLILELDGEHHLFQVLGFPDRESLSTFLKKQHPLDGTFVPGYRVAFYLCGALDPTSKDGPEGQIVRIKQARKDAMDWLREQEKEWAEYIEPFHDEGIVVGGDYALNITTGQLLKALEVTKI